MEVLIKVVQLILCLSLLVVVHEFGHYMFAKIFKTRVEKFYLFFNPWFSLFKKKIGETEYGIGWIPFGGYVKISGMIDESMDKDQMAQEPQPYEFRSKPAWQRLLIMVGGVMMNIITAFIIYIFLSYNYGEAYISNDDVRDGYEYSETAQKMGFVNGDKIINIGGEKIDNYQEITEAIIFNSPEYAVVERNGENITLPLDNTYLPELLTKGNWIVKLRVPYVIDSILVDGAAFKAGIQKGDSAVSVDGIPMTYLDQYKSYLKQHAADSVSFELIRNGIPINLDVLVSDSGMLGVNIDLVRGAKIYPVREHNYSFIESIPVGIKRTGVMIDNYIKQIKLIFTPETEAYKSVGSVVAMGNFFPATWDWFRFWNITAFFSVILAIMNMLPIPALDGGHVLFLLYEVITRRKPSEKFMEYAQMFGMMLLLLIMALALGNDIYKLFV